MHGYEESLLKVREREIQKGAWWVQESGSRKSMLLFSQCF
jgi:hypothetical protein